VAAVAVRAAQLMAAVVQVEHLLTASLELLTQAAVAVVLTLRAQSLAMVAMEDQE
jgi:hypothetical protein